MLGASLRQTFQAVASSSTRYLHTSPVTQAAKQASSVVRKQNILQQAKRAKEALSDRPSVVLGTRPSEEASKWPTCKLAKVLVDEEALARGEHIQPVQLPIHSEPLAMPTQLAFGVGAAEKDLLFNQLPEVSAEVNVSSAESIGSATKKGGVVEHTRRAELASQIEAMKAFNFSRVIDLRNTNAGGIAFENRRRIVLAFSTPENPYDTGRAEVQAALKTYEIRKLWKHLTTFKRDVGNRLGLRKLVHQRAKILRYLRNKNRNRYETLLEQLALEPEAVEGELVV